MAEHVLITPTTGRRRLGAGLLAAVAGSVITSGIAAGAAASVTDLAPADPDARLIALCNRYMEADRRHLEMCGQQNAMSDPRQTAEIHAEWQRLDDLVGEQGLIMLEVEDEIEALRATSPAGIEAKARVVSRVSRFLKKSNGGPLVRSLLADLLPAGSA